MCPVYVPSAVARALNTAVCVGRGSSSCPPRRCGSLSRQTSSALPSPVGFLVPPTRYSSSSFFCKCDDCAQLCPCLPWCTHAPTAETLLLVRERPSRSRHTSCLPVSTFCRCQEPLAVSMACSCVFVCGFAHLASRIAEWHRAAVACVGGGRDAGLVCLVTPRPLCRRAPLRTKSSNCDRLHLVFHERGRVCQAGTPPCREFCSTASASTGAYAETRGTLVERTRHKLLMMPSSSGAAGSVPVSFPTWCPCSRPDDLECLQGKCTTPPATGVLHYRDTEGVYSLASVYTAPVIITGDLLGWSAVQSWPDAAACVCSLVCRTAWIVGGSTAQRRCHPGLATQQID